MKTLLCGLIASAMSFVCATSPAKANPDIAEPKLNPEIIQPKSLVQYCFDYNCNPEEIKFRDNAANLKYIFVHGISGEHAVLDPAASQRLVEEEKKYLIQHLHSTEAELYSYDYYARFSSCSAYTRLHLGQDQIKADLIKLNGNLGSVQQKETLEQYVNRGSHSTCLNALWNPFHNFFRTHLIDIGSYYDDPYTRTQINLDLGNKINTVLEKNQNRDLVIIAYSLGTGIVYDTLKTVPITHPERITLITVGSQLGRGPLTIRTPLGVTVFNYAPLRPLESANELKIGHWYDIYGGSDPTALTLKLHQWHFFRNTPPWVETIPSRIFRPSSDLQLIPKHINHDFHSSKQGGEIVDYATAIEHCILPLMKGQAPPAECQAQGK